MDGKINIAFSSTGYGPLWAPAVNSWLKTIAYTARYAEVFHLGKVGGTGVTDRQYTHQAENQLVSDFLDHPEMTHLFMTEADMILPHECVVKLLELDKDVVTGVYFLRAREDESRGKPCLFKRPKVTAKDNKYGVAGVTLFPHDKPFRVDASGVGCVLIKRKVFETLEYPWFDLSAKEYGSDIYFYKKVREANFEIWAHPEVKCNQIDYYECGFDDYLYQCETNPQFAASGYIIGADANDLS